MGKYFFILGIENRNICLYNISINKTKGDSN